MTWRTIWTPSGSYFPAHCDHATEDEANRHALRMSREIQGEVAAVPLPNVPTPEPARDQASGTTEGELA